MLQAAKTDIVYSLHKSATDLQRLELDYFLTSLSKLAFVSGTFLGFGIFSLVDVPLNSTGSAFEIAQLITAAISTGCLMICLTTSISLVVWGPGLALGGARGTADIFRAVRALERGLDWAFGMFCAGLSLHAVVCMFTVLVKFPLVPAGILGTTMFLIGIIKISLTGESIVHRLVPKNVTSATLKGDPIVWRPSKFPRSYVLNEEQKSVVMHPDFIPGVDKFKPPNSTRRLHAKPRSTSPSDRGKGLREFHDYSNCSRGPQDFTVHGTEESIHESDDGDDVESSLSASNSVLSDGYKMITSSRYGPEQSRGVVNSKAIPSGK